jgi:hypothetical protein
MPLVINDVAFAVVFDIAQAVPADRRSDFVAAVVARCASEPALGPGVVHRAAAEIQPRFVPPVDDPRTGAAASRRRA